jgi:NADH-quinone oxidoreductase subunit N
VAALALLTRVLYEPFSSLTHQWNQIVVFAAVASMILGSFAGLVQPNLKRLMAYSSIANVGFALVAIATDSVSGIQGLLIYLSIYFLNTLGIFAVIMCLRRKGQMVDRISDLSGLGKTNPLVALAMVFFMFSIAGVPPFAGFFGKYFIFLAAVKAHMVALAVIGMVTSVVSSYYYLRIVKVMYFDDAREPIDPVPNFGVKIVLGAAAAYMLLFTVYPSYIVDKAMDATHSFLGG